MNVFHEPLLAIEAKGKLLIPQETRKLIFGNVEVLYTSHLNFLEKLRERTQAWNIDSTIGDLCGNLFSRKKMLENYTGKKFEFFALDKSCDKFTDVIYKKSTSTSLMKFLKCLPIFPLKSLGTSG